MEFVFLDTNIYLDCATLRREGHDPALLTKLKDSLVKKKQVLLIPEVVVAEFERIAVRDPETLLASFLPDQEAIMKALPSTETDRKLLQDAFQEAIDKITADRRKAVKEVTDAFFSDEPGASTKVLTLTPEVLTEAAIAIIAGRRPSRFRRANALPVVEEDELVDIILRRFTDADTLIILTLSHFMAGNANSTDTLIFCSADVDAYHYQESGTSLELHPEVASLFDCQTRLYPSLSSLVESEYASSDIDVKAIQELEEKQEATKASPFDSAGQTAFQSMANIAVSPAFSKMLADQVKLRENIAKTVASPAFSKMLA
ncbi:MAG: hypothetical protein C4521_07745, partial [Actinobacteria bacterium]